MTKTPDDVKKGLECCHINDEDLCECEDCPYADKGWQTARCDIELAEDALALIQQLQAQNAEKDAKIQRLETQNTELLEKIEQLQEEAFKMSCKVNRLEFEKKNRESSYGHAGPGIRENY